MDLLLQLLSILLSSATNSPASGVQTDAGSIWEPYG